MQDQHTELTYHPRELLSCQGVERVLCVAPHPDDEVFGCGGLLAALAGDGCEVHTVIVTSGEAGADPVVLPNQVQAQALRVQRQAESCLAAQELGTPPPEFLGLEDRRLRYGPLLVEALAQAIRQHEPQILLLPSLSEPHPDHQATALAGLAAARDAGPALHSVLFYECGAPLHANVHFPIDTVSQRKWRAVQRFASQLGMEDYEGHARAMATLRAFGLRPACREAESFFRVDMGAVREKGALAALPQWPWVRQRLELANDPAQLPLVSVLVRSMNRACLPEALASVALQTHANLELVLVNASGQPHAPLDYLPATLPRRIVEPPETLTGASGPAGPSGATRPCCRARAANLALQAARGELALFLDDDDLLDPPHLERLIAALQAHSQAVGAYAGVRVETHDGTHLRDYDLPWSRERLQGVNFLPIHAVLFRMNCVRQRGLRFDEDLPVLEDWDFWLQLTEGADLVHCPGVSAVYRQGLGQSALGDPAHLNHWRVWHRRLLERRTADAPRDALAATLAWHAVELDRAQTQAARLATSHQAELARLEQAGVQALQQTQALESALTQAQTLAQQHQAARDALQQRLEVFSLETKAALAQREAQAQQFAAQAQRELDAAQTQLQLGAAEHVRLLQAKEAELQRVATEHAHLLQAKEAELQRFSIEVRHALDAKEAELQRVAADARQALQAQATEHQSQQELMKQSHAAVQEALSREISALQQRLEQREADLRAVLASRSWRWTAMLRRGGEPLAEPGP
jgi:LmbE family N-acetylglucosaminyl deacetylase